jgi:hypothetical protein
MKIIFNLNRTATTLCAILLLNACGNNVSSFGGKDTTNKHENNPVNQEFSNTTNDHNNNSVNQESSDSTNDQTVDTAPEQPLNNSSINASAKKIGKLEVSSSKRMLQIEEKGFFWMADTAWKMPAVLTKDEIQYYLNDREKKGFNIIQISASYGIKPFNDAEYSEPNKKLWDRIDFIVDEAAKRGMFIALLPSWNDKLPNVHVATKYGKWIATRYKDKQNIIWVNGGDSNGGNFKDIWNALGEAIKSVDNKHLMTYHPSGSASSSDWFKDAKWIDFNMMQSGHRDTIDQANKNFKDKYTQSQNKPILDGEPAYETIEKEFWNPNRSGERFTADDVRITAYRQLFAGAFGHTYGHQSIWQMYTEETEVVEAGTVTKIWKEALNDKGGIQVGYAAKLMRSRPILSRKPSQVILKDAGDTKAMEIKGDGYAFIYLTKGGSITAKLSSIAKETVTAWWYNPRIGKAIKIDNYPSNMTIEFKPEDNQDWVLVLDDTSKEYGVPGK